jgi:hypothetical protein
MKPISMEDNHINHLSLHLAGDPLSDPPHEAMSIDPRTDVAAVIGKIKDSVDEKLTIGARLLVTGRVGLLPALVAARGDFIDEIQWNSECFGAYLTSPYGLFCPLRQTVVTEPMKV